MNEARGCQPNLVAATDASRRAPRPPEGSLDGHILAPSEHSLLQETQDRLNALFEGVETGIFIIDPESHRLLDANSVAAAMVGAPREQIVGSLCHQFVCPAEKGRCPVTDLGQTVDNSERVLLTASGERRAIIKTVRSVVVSGRRLLLESFVDITQLKNAEKALKERTAYLHLLIETTPLGILVLDEAEHIVMSNAAFERLFLYTQEEVTGALWSDLIFPGGSGSEACDLAGECLERGSVQAAARRYRKDGTLVDVRIFAARLDIDAKPSGFLALYEDITAQMQAEKSLRESEDRFRTAFEDAPYGMCMTAPDGHFMHANAALCAMLGLSAEELLAGAWQQLTHPEDMARSRQAGIELNSGARALVEMEKRYIHKGGSILWARIRILPVRAENGEISHFITQVEDITQRRQADEAQAFLASLVESSPDAIVGMTLDGTVVSWNQGARELSGYTAEEMIGRPVTSLVLPERLNEAARIFRAVGGGERMSRYETALLRKDGTRVSVSLTFSPVRDSKGSVTGIASIGHDITQRKLREQQTQLQTAALDSAASGIVITDCSGKILWVNRAFTDLTGYRAEEVLGRTPRMLKSGTHDGLFYQELWSTILRGDAWRGEIVNRRKDGTLYDEEMTINPVRAADGSVHHFVAVKQDITERKKAADAQAFLASLVESSPDAIIGTSLDGTVMSWNRGAKQLYGYTAEETLGKPISILVPPERASEAREGLEAAGIKGLVIRFETARVRKDGIEVDVALTLSPIRDATGKVTGITSVAHDITERKFREQQTQLQTAALESTANSIVITDNKGTILWVNPAFTRLTGYAAEEVLGKTPCILESGAQDNAFYRKLWSTILRGDNWHGELVYRKKDGTLYDEEMTITPVRGANGAIRNFVAVKQDITERKRSQEELLFKNALLETEAEATIDGILVVDGNGRRIQSNRRFAEMFNLPVELIDSGDDQKMLTHALSQVQDPEAFIQRVQSLYANKSEKARDEIQMKDGRCLDRYSAPLREAGSTYFGRVWYFRDITASKQAEQALRENEQRYRELFENASSIIFTTDLDARIASLNHAGRQLLGYSEEEAAQTDLWRVTVPEYWEVLRQDRARMLAGEAQVISEIEVVAKDGRRIRLEVKPRLIWHRGKPVGVQSIARDITGRDIAEMELRQAQKLESVGRLASGIAHEINTPIQFVGDNTRFLDDSFTSLKTLLGKFGELRDAASVGAVSPELVNEVRRAEEESDCAYLLEEIPRAITQTMEGVDRVATIVRAMKEFAHPENKEMAPADLNKALQSTLTVARNEWKYVADVDTDLADLPLVVCNIGDLNQVFLNLLVNAAHAIADVVREGGKGRIVIRTAAEHDKVHISISDTGSGIPESIRNKIFDPFFTTKEVGRGTGQGLAIARSVIVDRHKGTLTFDSEVGKGTTFHIQLPVSVEIASTKL